MAQRAWTDLKKHRWLAIIPLLALIWHSVHAIMVWHPQHLLFLCYSSNLLLVGGIWFRNRWLIGIGFGWVVLGFPLWLIYAINSSDFAPSSILLHLSGVFFGVLALRAYGLPQRTGLYAFLYGLSIQLITRCCTRPEFNINGSFGNFFPGLVPPFPSLVAYYICILSVQIVYFIYYPRCCSRLLCQWRSVENEPNHA
jgi:hypothetical protein